MNPEYDQIKYTQAYNAMMDSADSIMSAMMHVYNNAIELTKLIVENRIRDKELMMKIYMRYTANHLADVCQII